MCRKLQRPIYEPRKTRSTLYAQKQAGVWISVVATIKHELRVPRALRVVVGLGDQPVRTVTPGAQKEITRGPRRQHRKARSQQGRDATLHRRALESAKMGGDRRDHR